MLRDQAEETMDMEVLDEAEIEDLNKDSIRGYRNSHKSFKPGHPFERLDDNESIIKEDDKLTLENPGYIRLGKEQMRRGGKSDPRNKSLMKMFNLIDIGEHAGSGVPNIFNVWEDEGWEEPVIEESFDPDRTSLILRFVKKQAIKTSDKKQAIKTSDKKQANKTDKNMEKIRWYLQKQELAKTRDIAEVLGLSVARTRVILSEMDDVEALGTNRNRTYRLKL